MDGDSGTKETLPISVTELVEMANYCNDAYAEHPDHYQVKDDELSYTVRQDLGATILSFRGTDNGKNVLTDLDIRPFEDNKLDLILHRGFRDSAEVLYEDIKEKYKLSKIVLLTGHSLGGAIAQIIGLWLEEDGHHVQIYTFGSPKISTTNIGTQPPHYRVVFNNDPVPFMPPFPYVHSGTRIDAKSLHWDESDDYGKFTEIDGRDHSMKEYLNILREHEITKTRP